MLSNRNFHISFDHVCDETSCMIDFPLNDGRRIFQFSLFFSNFALRNHSPSQLNTPQNKRRKKDVWLKKIGKHEAVLYLGDGSKTRKKQKRRKLFPPKITIIIPSSPEEIHLSPFSNRQFFPGRFLVLLRLLLRRCWLLKSGKRNNFHSFGIIDEALERVFLLVGDVTILRILYYNVGEEM